MANLLEFLRDLVDGDHQRRAYVADREGYVVAHGLADLTGEDVVEALGVVRDQVPPDQAAVVDTAVATSPAAAPDLGAKPLDAALILLDHLVVVVEQQGAAEPAPSPETDDESERDEVDEDDNGDAPQDDAAEDDAPQDDAPDDEAEVEPTPEADFAEQIAGGPEDDWYEGRDDGY